jgi:hypothetical protein
MLVRESLDRFMMLNEDFLAENVLNEKININQIIDRGKKTGVLAAMFAKFLVFGADVPKEEVRNLPPSQEIAQEPIIQDLAQQDSLTREEIFNGFRELWDQIKGEESPRIFSAGEPGFIEAINNIKPGRLDTSKIAQYDKYDDNILKAAENLRAKGEDADPNLIKAMMMIETGMNPRKNHLGYEGFPQTKDHIINGWKDKEGNFHPGINQKHGTSFTLKDMYDPQKAAEFMHYYMKAVSGSRHVQDLKDLIIAYNWGVGNLIAYKSGKKDLPKQSEDYVKMVDAMQDYFPTS